MRWLVVLCRWLMRRVNADAMRSARLFIRMDGHTDRQSVGMDSSGTERERERERERETGLECSSAGECAHVSSTSTPGRF